MLNKVVFLQVALAAKKANTSEFVCLEIAKVLALTNPAFGQVRFMQACGYV